MAHMAAPCTLPRFTEHASIECTARMLGDVSTTSPAHPWTCRARVGTTTTKMGGQVHQAVFRRAYARRRLCHGSAPRGDDAEGVHTVSAAAVRTRHGTARVGAMVRNGSQVHHAVSRRAFYERLAMAVVQTPGDGSAMAAPPVEMLRRACTRR